MKPEKTHFLLFAHCGKNTHSGAIPVPDTSYYILFIG